MDIATDSPAPSETTIPTTTSNPTQTEEPAPTETPAPTELPAFLPGIAPADVKVNLEERQFTCTSAEQGVFEEQTFYTWTCERDDADVQFIVIFTSRSLQTVDHINASVIQFGSPSNEIAATFLGFVATIPFIGSDEDQAAARAWIEETLPKLTGQPGDVHSTTIRGVAMELFGPATGRSLRMGDLR